MERVGRGREGANVGEVERKRKGKRVRVCDKQRGERGKRGREERGREGRRGGREGGNGEGEEGKAGKKSMRKGGGRGSKEGIALKNCLACPVFLSKVVL